MEHKVFCSEIIPICIAKLFGVAVLYDETFHSFKWLIETYLEAKTDISINQFIQIKMLQWDRQFK
jgi:hypothetical protein